MRSVREAIEEISGVKGRNFSDLLLCEILSVDMDNRKCTCQPLTGKTDTTIIANLMADETDGILIKPTVGSSVMVANCSIDAPFVFMFSDIDGFSIITSDGKTQFYINLAGGIQFNDGTYGGLIKIEDLVSKLNTLENKVNDLISDYNTHAHTGVTTGPGTSGTPTSPISGSITPTIRGDIENTLITHGK